MRARVAVLVVVFVAVLGCKRKGLHEQVSLHELRADPEHEPEAVTAPPEHLQDRVVVNRRWSPPARTTRRSGSGRITRLPSRYARQAGVPARVEAPADTRDEPASPCTETNARVVLYGASWCGACQAARAWMRARGVAFVDRDVDRDPCAQDEMTRRLRQAGMTPQGIPVIAVGSRVMVGFSPTALSAAGI